MKQASLGILMLWPTTAMAEVPALRADAPNQTVGTLCAKRKLDDAEAGLATARDALQAKLNPNGRRILDLAQKAWRCLRDCPSSDDLGQCASPGVEALVHLR